MSSRALALLLLLLPPPASAAQDQPAFADPAPPELRILEPAGSPRAEDHPGLRFVAAPRPRDASAADEDSPGFLGARREPRSRETGLARSWPEGGPPLVWSVERGQGFASPAVAQGRVVFPHRVGAQTHVDCLEAQTGRRFWRHSFPTDYRGRYISDSGPRASPLIAGGRVFVHGVEGTLRCLELETGRLVWRRDLKAEFGLGDGFFGVVSSPLAHGDDLIVNLGAPGGPCVAAFDRASGRLEWGAGREWGASCASPVLAEVHGRQRLFVLTGGESRPPTGGLMVLDPASGALDFSYPFRSRTYESVNGANPLVVGSRVFLTAAYNVGTAALELDGQGGFEELWRVRQPGIEFANPVHVDGHLYMVDGVHDRMGAVVCLDARTGEVESRTELHWDEQVETEAGERTLGFSIGAGSLLYVDGRFLCLGDYGHLLWLDCAPAGAEVLARASLFRANQSWTPLVLSRGLLYVCQNRPERFGDRPARLLCYDLRAAQ